MKGNNYTQSLLTHRVEDLYQTYVQVLFSRYLFGPKGQSHFFNDTLENFTVRGRYLLSQVTSAQLESMFQATGFIYHKTYWITPVPESFVAVASWLAGLLKQDYFIPHITQLIREGGTFYYAHAWFGALFLFDDPGLSKHYVDFLEKQNDSSNQHTSMAMSCLQLWDAKYGTNHQSYIQNHPWQRRSTQYLKRFLQASNVLTAGIAFQKAHQLQEALTQLIQETATLEHYAHSFFYPPVIGRYYDEVTVLKQYNYYMDQYRTAGKFSKTPPLTETKPLKIHRTTYQFENEVRAYLQNPHRQAYFPEIKKAALLAQDMIDVLAGLEIDIYYLLPPEIIEICYQKLLTVLPHSYFLFEAYALALLMRGNQHDQTAKALYEKAQQIKAKYEWVEDYNIWWDRYVQVRN